jgi:hypothetical protein
VTAQDVQMLGRLPARRAARRWAKLIGGRTAAHAMGDYQRAATALCLAHRLHERGTTDQHIVQQHHDALIQAGRKQQRDLQ